MEERELLTVELEVFRVERGHGRFVFGVVLHVVLRIERCGTKIAALQAFRRSQGTTRDGQFNPMQVDARRQARRRRTCDTAAL